MPRWLILLPLLLLLTALVYGYVTTVQPVWGKEACDAAPVDPARLLAHVRMLSQTLVPRDTTHPENLDRVAAYIRGELERAGLTVEEQVFQVEGHAYRNVLARVGPESPSRPGPGGGHGAVASTGRPRPRP